MEKVEKGGKEEMNGFYFLAFLLGILSFGIGLGIGWNMRGSVKENNFHQLSNIFELMQKLGYKIDDLKKVK